MVTDASGVGLGAILSQKQSDGQLHPIAYASRALDPNEKNYAITELETLAVVWAARKFQPYLLGHRTTVFTDHSACVSVLSSARPSGKLARWALTLQELDLTLKHRAGKLNANADALSRNPIVNLCKDDVCSSGVSETSVVDGCLVCLNVLTSDDFCNNSLEEVYSGAGVGSVSDFCNDSPEEVCSGAGVGSIGVVKKSGEVNVVCVSPESGDVVGDGECSVEPEVDALVASCESVECNNVCSAGVNPQVKKSNSEVQKLQRQVLCATFSTWNVVLFL